MRRAALSLTRPHKYNAIKTAVNGFVFASKKEAARYQELLLLEKVGEVRELELQPRFTLNAPVPERSNVWPRIGDYVADFRYRRGPQGLLVIEDVKGVRTALYRWKKKHFEAQYGIQITEI